MSRENVVHPDDMTVKNFYRHMQARHPIPGIDLDPDLLHISPHDGGAYRACLAYHERLHALEVGEQFDHGHDEAELTCE